MSNARVVILFLGTLALFSLGGIIFLVSQDRGVPDVLIATVSGSIASLGSILAKTSSDAPTVSVDPPATVTVTDGEPEHRA